MQSNDTKASRPAQRKRHGPRMLLACINCKDRKLKCDDHVPACRNCQQSGLVCLVEDPATKRRQPRNYLETLEKRVDQLERILRRRSETGHVRENPDQDDYSALGFQPDNTAVRTELIRNEHHHTLHTTTTNENEDTHQMDDLAARVGMLTVAAGAEPHYLGPSSAVNFCRVINPTLLQAIPKPKDTHSFEEQSELHSMLNVCPFPDPQSCLQLSDAYFHHIHPQYPFLHEPTFREWEANIWLSESSDLSESDPASIFFLYMVYAIGALILPNQGYFPKRLYASAQLYSQSVLQRENLEAIQAYLCYAIYSLRSPTGASVWKFSGLALRQCIELGYHRHGKILGLPRDALYFELRKRVFWCAWTIDTLAATLLGRPLCLRDEEVDCELPRNIDGLNGATTNITKGLCTFRLRKLWAQIHASLYSDLVQSNPSHPTYLSRVKKFRDELESWRASLPAPTPQTETPLTLFTSSYWHELDYNYTILSLYRGQLTDIATCTETTLSECFSAAGNICHGLRTQLLDNKATPTWGALHSCFIAGLTYLHCLWSSASIRKACRQNVLSSTCTDCTIALVLITQWHEAAAPYREIFECLAARTMAMLAEKSEESTDLTSDNSFTDLNPVDPATVSQWKTDISNHGIMGDSFEELLNSLITDFPRGS